MLSQILVYWTRYSVVCKSGSVYNLNSVLFSPQMSKQFLKITPRPHIKMHVVKIQTHCHHFSKKSLCVTILCCFSIAFSGLFFPLFLHSTEPSSSFDLGDTSGFDDGLRRRNVPSFDAPRPRTSDEEDDEEEVEFKLAEKKEEKSWLSVNKCIVGALILLFLGSLFLSGELLGLKFSLPALLSVNSEQIEVYNYKLGIKWVPAYSCYSRGLTLLDLFHPGL